jgi:hypothetical protein
MAGNRGKANGGGDTLLLVCEDETCVFILTSTYFV